MTEERATYETDPRADLSALPRVDTLVAAAGDLVAAHGRAPTLQALRLALDTARHALRHGDRPDVPDAAELVAAAAAALASRRPGPPRRVINATGVIVHTNLGRAPLSAAARRAMEQAAGACDLEFDLDTGGRGSRTARLEPLLVDATGAEAGLAVNNCAAALVLCLAALASGRAVLVSRGELVEIGGSFRLPEVMAASGALLREVGTTNKTRAADFMVAEDVAAILKVHPSNYRITGFVQEPSVAELAEIARAHGIPLIHDVGSGLLDKPAAAWARGEPTVRGSLDAGADLVLASGDKLLGGPQAGLLVGRADLVDRCRRHPLARALRLDKLRIAALVATLEAHLRGPAPGSGADGVPVWAMLQADPEALQARAAALAAAVDGEVVPGASLVGGGAAPGAELAGPVVRVACAGPDEVARRLRAGDPPVVVRVEDGAVWLDPRTIPPADDAEVADAVTAARAQPGQGAAEGAAEGPPGGPPGGPAEGPAGMDA
jgi:L-seryl-tRNA(Ser) seleniumtransferase